MTAVDKELVRKHGGMLTDTPNIIDIEASGFGKGSYPIEVGVVLTDGSSHCYLLKPLPEWTHWSEEAEQTHGINRNDLQKFGLPPREVAESLNMLLENQLLYSDAWSYDNGWISQLFYDVNLVPRFRIESLRNLLDEAIVTHWESCRQAVMQDLNLTRHRASADARILQQTFVRARAKALAPEKGAY